MSEDELTPEEYNELLKQQARIQSGQGEIVSPSDMAEYTEMLAVDKAFKVDDEKGEISQGNVPKESLLSRWGINNKNFVWSNFTDKSDRKRVLLMELDAEFADSMYEINWKLAKANPELFTWAVREKQNITNSIQQRIHTFAKIQRTVGPDRERKMFGTNTGQFASENPQNKKQSFLANLLGGLTGK